jgi:hypothetical protein
MLISIFGALALRLCSGECPGGIDIGSGQNGRAGKSSRGSAHFNKQNRRG